MVRGGDEVIGFGGIAYLPDGTTAMFVVDHGDGAKYPVSLHRAGLKVMQMARDLGLNRVVAQAEEGLKPAVPWLKRLGFKPVMIDEEEVWVWHR